MPGARQEPPASILKSCLSKSKQKIPRDLSAVPASMPRLKFGSPDVVEFNKLEASNINYEVKKSDVKLMFPDAAAPEDIPLDEETNENSKVLDEWMDCMSQVGSSDDEQDDATLGLEDERPKAKTPNTHLTTGKSNNRRRSSISSRVSARSATRTLDESLDETEGITLPLDISAMLAQQENFQPPATAAGRNILSTGGLSVCTDRKSVV